jgi:hypothetical protein
VRRLMGIVASVAIVAGAAGCGDLAAGGAQTKPGPAAGYVPPQAQITSAKAKLAELPTAVPDRTGYQRTRNFGPAWSVDTDRNGCGTRDDILRRDLTKVQLRGRCTVIAGVLADPYTGATVTFRKAQADEVQIDHVVPLAAAWSLGARTWTQRQRERFANDPLNLMATSRHANLSKGDSRPSQWLPRPGFRCTYAVRYVQVSGAYGLSVTAADRSTLATLLRACPAGR